MANIFARFKEGEEPATPPAGKAYLWFDDTDGVFKYKNSSGEVYTRPMTTNDESTVPYVTNGSLAIGGPNEEIATLGWDNFGVQIKWTVEAATAKDFVDADVNPSTNIITETAHGYLTGLKGQLTTTGTLPDGLSLATDYFVIKVDADTYKLATSRANANSGTAVDIVSASGGGTHTFTPTAGGTVGEFIVEGTNFPLVDDVWDPLDLSMVMDVENSSDVGSIRLNQVDFSHLRVSYVPTSGQGTYSIYLTKRDI